MLRIEPDDVEAAYFGLMGQGEILNVTEAEYHADPCVEPSLSSTIAKLLVDESPEKARLAHPRMGGRHSPSSPAMDDGKVIHELLLGRGAGFVEVDADNFKTNAAKSARDAAKADGKTPILACKLEALRSAAAVISSRLRDEFDIVMSGRSEVAVCWREPVFMTDATVECRAMFDHVFFDDGVIFDLKKTYSANPDKCESAINEYGYHVQRAAYVSALEKLRPEHAGKVDFVNIFFELEPPYAVTPLRMDGAFRSIGDQKWRRGVKLWHDCMTSGKWPGYVRCIGLASPKQWVIAEALNRGMKVESDL